MCRMDWVIRKNGSLLMLVYFRYLFNGNGCAKLRAANHNILIDLN